MRGIILSMAIVHIPEVEAARDLTGLLARVRGGEEIAIAKDFSPAVILRVDVERPLRKLSESLRLAKEHGSTATLDGNFGRDLEVVINGHPEPLKNLWG